MRIVTAYSVFAGIAIAVNIGAQDLAVWAYAGPHSLVVSVGAGTLAGLLCKYILDKRYIFRFKPKDLAHDGKTFLLYTAMGVVTTMIFWGLEFGFDLLFKTRELRYLGGVLGLAIGYLTKYHLDRHFVFLQGESS